MLAKCSSHMEQNDRRAHPPPISKPPNLLPQDVSTGLNQPLIRPPTGAGLPTFTNHQLGGGGVQIHTHQGEKGGWGEAGSPGAFFNRGLGGGRGTRGPTPTTHGGGGPAPQIGFLGQKKIKKSKKKKRNSMAKKKKGV